MPRGGKRKNSGRGVDPFGELVGAIGHGYLVEEMRAAALRKRDAHPSIDEIKHEQGRALRAGQIAREEGAKNKEQFDAMVGDIIASTAETLDQEGRLTRVQRAPKGARERAYQRTIEEVLRRFGKRINADMVKERIKLYRRRLPRL